MTRLRPDKDKFASFPLFNALIPDDRWLENRELDLVLIRSDQKKIICILFQNKEPIRRVSHQVKQAKGAPEEAKQETGVICVNSN